MTVCIHIMIMLTLYCEDNANLPQAALNGEAYCLEFESQWVCYLEPEQLPIRASWYYPPWGKTNCVEPCNELGNGYPVHKGYGTTAACEEDLYGHWFEVPEIGAWHCYDNGGFTAIQYGRVYTQNGWWEGWYITMDFLADEEPYWNYWVFDDWELQEYSKMHPYRIGKDKGLKESMKKELAL